MLRPHKFRSVLRIRSSYLQATNHRLTFLLQHEKQIHLSSSRHAWFLQDKRNNKTITSASYEIMAPSKNLENSDVDDIVLQMELLRRDPKIKIDSKLVKLRGLIFQAIENSPDNYLESQHLKAVEDALHFISTYSFDRDFFSDDKMITILKSSIKNLKLGQVRDLSFIPIIYSKLSKSQSFIKNKTGRLQMWEILFNYLLLSDDKTQVVKLIDTYLWYYPDQNFEVLKIALDAMENSRPDSASLVLLANYYDFHDGKINIHFMDLFIRSLELETELGAIVERASKLSSIILVIPRKAKNPLPLYIKLLKHCYNNNFHKQLLALMENLARFPSFEVENEDDLSDLMIICLLYKNRRKVCEKILASNKSDIARLEYMLSNATANGEKSFAEFLESGTKPLLDNCANVDNFNRLLQVCLNSNKDKNFINDFDDFFQEEYGIGKNALTYTILIRHSIQSSEFSDGEYIFERSIEDDFINWGKEEDGKYMKTIMELFAGYTEHESDIQKIHNFYKKIRNFGHKLNETALTSYFSKLIDNKLVGDSLTLLEQELLTSDHHEKLQPKKFRGIYDKLLDFINKFDQGVEVNEKCFLKLDEIFQIHYRNFLPVMGRFCDYQRPELAYNIFSKVRAYARDGLIQPPKPRMYVYLFTRFGELLYQEGIFKLHLLLKVDMNVNLDINLLNTVMESFANIGEILKVRDIFDTILSLPADRGLNSRTITIMLKSQTHASVLHLRDFWNGLSQLDYLPTRSNYKQYLIGHCYHDSYNQLLDLITAWDEYNELEIDEEILKILYNWTPSLEGKSKIEQFGNEHYQKIWKNLKTSGELIEEEEQLPSLVESGRDELLALK